MATKGGSARIRNRKISIKQYLTIIRGPDIPDIDEDSAFQRSATQIETGVDKDEEVVSHPPALPPKHHHLREHHLQAALASQAVATGPKPEHLYIPTPDASKKVKDYDVHYAKSFSQPTSYIRSSATVEDYEGCPYCMDEQDEAFLRKMISKRSKETDISEDVFELVMQFFEQITNENQPFLSLDPTNVSSFEELEKSLERCELSKYRSSAKSIYGHWRRRRLENAGKPLMPVLRFEENEKDEGDPYVCFRRREIRQVRKTRRTDAQSSEKLRKLRAEMIEARDLIAMVRDREKMRKDSLVMDHLIFNQRCTVKDVKRKLGIQGEDEDLVSHKIKKPRIQSEVGAIPLVRHAVLRHGSLRPEEPLIRLEDVRANKVRETELAVSEALGVEKALQAGWSDLSEISPVVTVARIPSNFTRDVSFIPVEPQEVLSSTSQDLPLSNSLLSNAFSFKTRLNRFQITRLPISRRTGRSNRTLVECPMYLRSRTLCGELHDERARDRIKYDFDPFDYDDVVNVDNAGDNSIRFQAWLMKEALDDPVFGSQSRS
ncbi:Enhancer of polycomb-like protein 1 [Neolecta irregularis DAH-3]|uniref:Enhancer of polycomb-like protein n=1 Tax=Neolecta irregularis (strain DAH-3) TaxID=1198029 RepID=A0A1U7LWY8_NEOID|nr:Enhancer of polycomb-like protein 1 [Neolecta irregularis DAH-3]|eukprot:OLL27154.1 Enhancer of polycomb-like protein 1 [Neolecta irregularis DAH-3]